MALKHQLAYVGRVLPSATWRALHSPARGPVHVILALADHFEPAIVPEDGRKRAPRSEQERWLESWAREYSKIVDGWRDHDGRPLVHTYFYPAEQYDQGLLDIKLHCHSMDPTQQDAVIGDSFRKFLAALVGGAAHRKETLYFVAAREMTNILLAACDGREGNPGYRDYRFQRFSGVGQTAEKSSSSPLGIG